MTSTRRPPPRSSDGKTRSVMRVCGLGLLIALAGCDRLQGKDEPSSGDAPAAGAEAQDDASAPKGLTAAAADEPARPPSMLAGVIDRAIAAPPEGGSTYRVDAYVAALVVEQLRVDPLPFMAWRRDDPEAAGPTAGFRVGAIQPDDVWTALGLAEGDIIESVNGVPTTDADWASEAIRRGENRVTVTIFREDVSFTLSYRLMGGMAWSGLVEEKNDPALVAVASPEEGEQSGVADVDGDGAAGDALPSGRPGSAATGNPSPGASRPSSGSGGSRPGSSGTSRPSKGSGGSGSSKKTVARCSSPSSCTLDKAYFDSMVRSPAKVQSQANVVPAIRNDVFSGYKLKSVRSGSAIHQLGFRSGDKITHINGRDLTNDLEAMQLYMGLSSTRTFKIRYVRGGSSKVKTVSVK